MKRKFSIITASKGRLGHLKASLPAMLRQRGAEVIVVDFSCDAGTGEHVATHFPSVRLVRVNGETYFSNWKARNAGAAVAKSDVLIFCDADTIMKADAIQRLSEQLPDNAFGVLDSKERRHFGAQESGLSLNQLRGFQAIPLASFQQVGGYDEVLEGYAAEGDTDLHDRLMLLGLNRVPLGPGIIEAVIDHDDLERMKHHRYPVAVSYGAALLYRRAKFEILRRRNEPNLPLKLRRSLYETAKAAASQLGPSQHKVAIVAKLTSRPVRMPRQLGFESGTCTVSLTVEVSMREPHH